MQPPEEAANPEAAPNDEEAAAPSGAAEVERISWITRVVFSAPVAGMMPFTTMFALYGITSYEAFGATLTRISIFTALARSLDVVSDPLMSYLTDTTRSKYGRRRPYLFVGAFPYALFLFLLMRPPYGDSVTISNWFGSMYILYFLSNTFVTIPYYALAPELSRDSDQRTGLFFTQSIVEGVTTLIAMAGPMVATLQVRLRNWNSWVCRPYSTQASLCLAGKTCSAVFEGGVGSAFKNDRSLQSLLAPLQQLPTNGITMPTDAQACSKWIQSRGRPVLGNLSTALQNDEFCQCMVTCDTACGVADERTGFEWVAWCFATWSLVAMLICVKMVKERPTAGRTSSPPMVPAMFNTLQNGPFRVLLPAWAMDAYCNAIVTSVAPYFSVIVIAPTYQEGCGDPSSDSYDQWFCDTGNVIVVCGVLVLLAAIVGLPFWHTMVRMIGKVRTWWLWSLTMALTNFLFMFLLEGWVIPFWIVSALNGVPLGAKFIADSILSDIIDYDEFLTGHRSEATYFMFKGFLPKIVQIPASAVPIALLGVVGYKSPIGGVEQRQGMSVVIYIKAVVFSCVIASSIAVLIKWRYPLRTAEHRNELQRGIEAHRRSEDYPDPVTKVSYRLMKVSGELQNTYWLLDHFRAQRLRRAFVEQAKQESREAAELLAAINLKEGARRILCITRYQLFASIVALVTSVVATIFSMRLLSDKNFSFVPTFTAVAVGLSVVALVFSSLRLRAAVRLEASANSGDLTEQIVAQVLLRRDLIGQVGMLRSEHRDRA